MAKIQYTRFEEVFSNREAAIEKLNSISRFFAEPVVIRYYSEEGNIVTLIALYRSEKIGDYVLQFDEERKEGGEGGDCSELEEIIERMLNYNIPLVKPVIKGEWNFYDNNGFPLVITPAPNKENPKIEKGYKARFTGVYSWRSELGKKNPVKVTSDSSWKSLPPDGTSSSPLESQMFSSDSSVVAGIQAPKTGLIVVGEIVKLAEGDDKEYDRRSVTFLDRIYYGFSTKSSAEIGESDIKKLRNTTLSNSRGRVLDDISAGEDEYFIYSYPKSMGPLSQIIQNYAQPVLTAFTQKEIKLTSEPGLVIDMYVYTSNNPGAFTKARLEFK